MIYLKTSECRCIDFVWLPVENYWSHIIFRVPERVIVEEKMVHFRVSLRFYEELNDFLHSFKKKNTYDVSFTEPRSVKDLIESQGVPHTEVDLILVDGMSEDFSYVVKDGDRISVYPVFESLDIRSLKRLKPPLRQTKFIVDSHLGGLARILRFYGFDTLFDRNYRRGEIVRIAVGEKRIIVTSSTGLLKMKEVTHAVFIREPDPWRQIEEVFQRVDLYDSTSPFSRCSLCNTLLLRVEKKSIEERIPPRVREWCTEFMICKTCDKIYWRGSHVASPNQAIKTIMEKKL